MLPNVAFHVSSWGFVHFHMFCCSCGQLCQYRGSTAAAVLALLTEGKQRRCPLSRWLQETPDVTLSVLEHHRGTVKGSVFRSSPSQVAGTGTGKHGVVPRLNGLDNPFSSDQIQPKLMA